MKTKKTSLVYASLKNNRILDGFWPSEEKQIVLVLVQAFILFLMLFEIKQETE
jgi:hypothetical protein